MANNKDFRVKNNLFVKGLGTSTFSGDVSVGDTITVQGAATFQDDVNFNGAFNPVSINASGNVVIGGNLTVNGTTTTVDTNNLNVKDKNITLNYSTGDSSALANGAGITIQDAVNSTTDATILWDSANDKFDFSHRINSPSASIADGIFVGSTSGASGSLGEAGIVINISAKPQILFDGGSDSTLDIAVPTGELLQIGHWDTSANSAVLQMSMESDGDFSFEGNNIQGISNVSTSTITSTSHITITGDNKQLKFTGTAGPLGLEFGDTEANPNFRVYYRTTPNTLTFENNASSAKHTFDLSGNYTSTGDITSGGAITSSGVVQLTSGNDIYLNNAGYDGSGTHAALRWFSTGSAQRKAADIITAEADSFARSDLLFRTQSGTSNADPTEVMRVTHDNLVGIATQSPSEKLHINGGSSDVALRIDTTNADPKIRLTTLGQQDWTIGIDHSDGGKLKICESGTVGTLTALTIDAARDAFFEGNISINDNKAIGIGTANDMLIKHDGSNTIFREQGDGNVIFEVTDATIQFKKGTTETLAEFIPDSGALLYHDTVLKFATTSDGSSTTGNHNATGYRLSGQQIIDSARNLISIASINVDGSAKSVFTNTSNSSIDLSSGTSGALQIGTASSTVFATIAGRQTNTTQSGLGFYSATADGNTSAVGDMHFNVRENNNSTFATLTKKAFVWTHFTSELMHLTRSGNLSVAGTISSGAITSSGTITSTGNGVTNVMSFSDRGIFGTTSNHPVEIRANGAEAIRIDTSQRVGINNQSPSSTLDVIGNAEFVLTNNSNQGFKITQTDNIPGQNINTLYIDHNCSGSDTFSGDFTHRGILVDLDSSATGGGTTEEHRITAIEGDARASGDSDAIRGVRGLAESQHSTGIVTSVYGLDGVAIADETNTARTTTIYGVHGLAQYQGTGTGGVTGAYGVYGKVLHSTASDKSNVGASSGVYAEIEIDNPGQSQTLTNNQRVIYSIFDNDSAGNVDISGRVSLVEGTWQGSLPTNPYNLYFPISAQSYLEGSLGIGTASADDFWAQAKSLVLDRGGNTGLTIKSTSTGNGRVVFTDTASSTAGFNDGGQIHYGHTDDQMRFRTAGADAVTIDSSQRVGIANNTPSNFFESHLVVGDGVGEEAITVYSGSSHTGYLLFGDATSGNARFAGQVRYNHAQNRLSFATNESSASKFSISSSGDLEMGSSFTTVIDSNRNLTNIGSYSGSGDMHLTGVGTVLKFDTLGSSGSNTIRVINNFETLISTNRGAAGHIVVGNSNIRMGFGSSYTVGQSDITINSTGTIDIAIPTSFAEDISLPDAKKIKLGTGDDLLLYHDGGSVIEDAGDQGLEIRTNGPDIRMIGGSNELMAKFVKDGAVELYYDNIPRLQTTSTGVNMSNTLDVQGATTFEDDVAFNAAIVTNLSVGANFINFADNGKARFGNSTDLQIYHDGTDSYVTDAGTGNLNIKSNGTFINFLDGSNNLMAFMVPGGAVGLYHNTSLRLTTQAAGIKINSADVGGVAAPILNVGQLNNAFQSGMESSVHLTMKTYNPSGNFYFYRQSNIQASIINGDFCIGQTAVITSARNLTNIGTVASGAITATANGTSAKQLQVIDSDNTTGRGELFHNGSTTTLQSQGTSGLGTVIIGGATIGASPTYATFNNTGVTIAGALSKGSGSFKIDHPLKPDTHHLVHSFIEGPQADNLYRGTITLQDGRAVIDLDEWFGMTPGTFLALNRDIQAFVSNVDDWDAVRAKMMGSQLVIECQNAESKASVSWLVVGERQDKEIYASVLTDDNGKIIVEPSKEVVE